MLIGIITAVEGLFFSDITDDSFNGMEYGSAYVWSSGMCLCAVIACTGEDCSKTCRALASCTAIQNQNNWTGIRREMYEYTWQAGPAAGTLPEKEVLYPFHCPSICRIQPPTSI